MKNSLYKMKVILSENNSYIDKNSLIPYLNI